MEAQLPKINHKQKKKNITSGSTILDFKFYYRAIVTRQRGTDTRSDNGTEQRMQT